MKSVPSNESRKRKWPSLERYTTTVGSAEEAITLALSWKETGKYDVFRGQPRNWELLSSLHRKPVSSYPADRKRLKRFYDFLSTSEELMDYLDDIDQVFAIAQHYGLPTNYIDFTYNPEVAMYFATHSRKNKPGELASIICGKKKHFDSVINMIKPVYFKKDFPYFIDQHVKNLWRLQAQQGCFLYTPIGGIESLYHFDRIVFPFSASYENELLKTEKIYPDRKSRLEILLDNYFMGEEISAKHALMRSLFPDMKIHRLRGHKIHTYLKPGTNEHPSWSPQKINKWKKVHDEKWNTVSHHLIIPITLCNRQEIETLAIEKQVMYFIKNNPGCRKHFLSAEITTSDKLISKRRKKKMEQGCKIILDGMRNLPYTDKHLSRALACYIHQQYAPVKDENRNLYIGMHYADGSHSKAYADGCKILEALREDYALIIKEKHTSILMDNPINALLCVNRPRYLFNFHLLVSLFAEEIIPSQTVRLINHENIVVYFNPAYLHTLGMS